ncbi:uncharacterized protein LOC134260414 [Saccostrea cucullata]|uniref:uncharacterized protein LOC134260414 n=1 Tax=Saccostrea cuccullata TaxID=36930 RepID=UPI002ED26FFD
MMETRIFACSSLQIRDHIFFSGIVGAAMKNKVTYNYKIKLTRSTGEPVNSHCECPAGKGPHGTCKHIAAVLLMLVDFVNTGEIEVEKSCTDNLQTFHKPKNYYSGSPMKAESLPSKRKFTESMLEDPRPAKYRNMASYNDYVRSVMINYCSSSSMDIALRYNYSKAYMQAASKDHDYLQNPLLEHWIDNSVTITDEKAKKIESSTRQQSQSSEWFKERKYLLTVLIII